MANYVLDASAVLAYLLAEKGTDKALRAMPGSCISVVNIAEVAAKLSDEGAPDDEARLSIVELGLEPVELDEAERLWIGEKLQPIT